MANGDYLTVAELEKYSGPLQSIKSSVESLAAVRGFEFIYNVRGWPSILIRWHNPHDLRCTLQLYMNVDKALFTLWIAVSKDINLKRYFFSEKIHETLSPPFDVQFLIQEIENGIVVCNQIKFEDLSLLE